VQELIAQGLIYEGVTGEAARGRKPTFLHVRTQDRLAIAVDVRFSKTYLMCVTFGAAIGVEIYDTVFSIPEFVKIWRRALESATGHGADAACEGVGVVVPGMVDQRTGRILNAPALGWRGIDLRSKLAAATGLPVHVENSDGPVHSRNYGLRKLRRLGTVRFHQRL